MNPKFHPILFQPEMVQANLAGRKTMTRRTSGLKKINQNPDGYYFQSLVLHATGRYTFAPQGNYNPSVSDIIEVKCPYGKPGDYLWVRETWQQRNEYALKMGFKKYYYKAGFKLPIDDEKKFKAFYKDLNKFCEEAGWKGCSDSGWRASIHMPKEAARIILQVEDVRLERLHAITDQDSLAEGIPLKLPVAGIDVDIDGNWWPTRPYFHFKSLWISIHGQQSWDLNPWLWVISYKVISITGCPEELKPLLFQTAKKSKK